MSKTILLIIALFTANCIYAQKPHLYASGQFYRTISDITKGNNRAGLGLGLQLQINAGSFLTPLLEYSIARFAGTKELYTYANGEPIPNVREMQLLMAGINIDITRSIFISGRAGIAYINQTEFTCLQPAVGIYFPASKRWVARIACQHIYRRDKVVNTDFTSMSYTIGIRLF